MGRGSLILVADILDQFGVQRDLPIAFGLPRGHVDRRDIHSKIRFESDVVETADTLSGKVSKSKRRPLQNPPEAVFISHRIDHENVAFPMSNRITLNARDRVL